MRFVYRYYDDECVCGCVFFCFFSSRRRHTRCALVTGVQTCALPILADTNPHASELIADVRFGRTQAVMPGSPAAALDLHLIGGKVQLVMSKASGWVKAALS